MSWKKIVEVTCPICELKRDAELRGRGTVRICLACGIRSKRAFKKWANHGVLHLQSKTPLYQVWSAMKQRCDVSTNASYALYGGRGISYCMEWREFLPFKEWAESHGYVKGLFIDRIDNDKGYEPSNCRWVTPKQSAINRRTTKYIEAA